jgi:hypothetical protein
MLTALLAATLACPPLTGIDAVLSRPGLQFLLFGEYHGTSEMPGLVADALCHAKASGRPVALGIELPASAQPALDSADPAALLDDPAWREEGGRTTQAIRDLIGAARRLGIRAVAFDALPTGDVSPEREQAMAYALARAGKGGALVIALTGVGHADKEGFTSRTPPILAAAGRLPQDRTLSLTFARPGGSFWGCHAANGGPAEGCRPYPMPAREPVQPRGIVLDSAYRGGFDGFYSAGRQYSASRPALQQD